MTRQHNGPPAPEIEQSSRQKGAVRRFLDGWRQLEQALDYGPYDYALDRVRALEVRVEQLKKLIPRASEPDSATESVAVPRDRDGVR
jgi:hypothetical protein